MSNGRIVDRRWRCSRALSCKHYRACRRWISIRRVLRLCVNSPGLRDEKNTHGLYADSGNLGPVIYDNWLKYIAIWNGV